MAPNKRTGTDPVQTPSKAKKVKSEPDSVEKLPGHGPNGPNPALIAKFDAITAEKGCTQWLMDWIETQGREEYVSYYDATYPPEKGVGYLTERDLETLKKEDGGSPCCLRLPQLALHPMSGNAGLVEAPTMRTLVLQVLSQGFLTDSDTQQGVEKLASRPMTTKEHPEAAALVMEYGDRRSNPLAKAFSIFHTKGWTRTIAAHLAVALVQECGLDAELSDSVRASFATIHTVLRPVRDLRESVERSRQITTSSTSTRRPVNCFNHLHQLRLLRIEGAMGADSLIADWNQKQIQNVFKIGPAEAAAANNLAFETTGYMAAKLAKMAEDFGMHNRYGPFNHTALASRLLCTGGVASGLKASWEAALTNTDETVNFLADRIDHTWRSTPKGFRKQLTQEVGLCAQK